MAATEVLAQLAVNLAMDSAAFTEGSDEAKKEAAALEKKFEDLKGKFEGFGSAMTKVGAGLTAGVTAPLIAFGKAAVEGAYAQRQAMAQVETALKTMGGASQRTADQLADASDKLELDSLFEGDEILKKVTANLLTFGNVAGAVFDRAQVAILDLSQRMGGDLQASTILVGKALNDPIKGIGALRKVGVQLNAQQAEQVKAFAASGQMAKAQSIILGELERQVGGSAKAAMEQIKPWRKVEVLWGQIGEKMGDKLIPFIERASNVLAGLLDRFNSLSPEMQDTVFKAGLFAAALGPIVTVAGTLVSAFAPVMALIGTAGLGATLSAGIAAAAPFAAALAGVAAAGYLIYENWDQIRPALEAVWAQIKAEALPALESLRGALVEMWNGPVGEAVRSLAKDLAALGVMHLKVFGPIALAALKTFVSTVSTALSGVASALRAVNALLKGEWSLSWDNALAAAKSFVSLHNLLMGGLPDFIAGIVQRMVSAIKTYMVGKLNEVWESVRLKIEAVKGFFFGLYDAVVGHSYIPDMVDGVGRNMARLEALMVEPAKKATKSTKDAFRQLADDVSGLLDRLFPAQAAVRGMINDLALLDKALKAGQIDGSTYSAARDVINAEAEKHRRENSPITDPGDIAKDIPLPDVMGPWRKQAEDLKKTNASVVEGFATMAKGVLDSLSGLVGSIKSGNFLDILGGVLGFVQQIAGLFTGKAGTTPVSAPSLPRFAGGGSMRLGGMSGVDTNVLSLNGSPIAQVSRGETMNIAPANERGGMTSVRVVPSPYFNVVVDRRAAGVAAPLSQRAAMAGSSGAQIAIARQRSRAIP